MFFTLALHWTYCVQGTNNIFLHQLWQICSPSRMFTQMEVISGYLKYLILLVRAEH